MNNDDRVSPSGSFSGFAAYIPCYEGGNSVTAVKKDGQTVLINKGIKSVIGRLLKENSIDICFLKKNFKEYTGTTNLMPLPLKLGTVLIPVKVRKTIVINDGAFAYIDLSSIKDVDGDKNAVIALKCGREINCLESLKTIKGRIKSGRIVEDKFASRIMGDNDFRESLSHIHSEYEKAATKGDITMLAYEILKLRERME